MSTASRLALIAMLAGAPALAQQPPNPIHPLFAPLDAAGRLAARAEDVSADGTCGACHDARYIAAHSEHGKAGARATCIQCHVDGGRLAVANLEGGKFRREDVRIGKPRTGNCASCHGLVSDGTSPILLPDGFEAAPASEGRTWSLTQGEGAVFAPQQMSDSFLDLQGKADLHAPWDAHAAKLVD